MAFPSFFLHIRIDNPCARPRLRSLLSLVQSLRSFSLFFLLLQCLCLRKLDKLVAVWILTSLSVARLSINFESFPSFLMNRSRFWRLFFYSWIRLTDSCWITDGRIFYSRLRYPSLYLNPHFLVNFYFPFLSCWSSTGFDGDLHGLAVLEGEQNKNGNFSKLFEDSGGTVRAQFRCVRSLANLTSWLLILLFFLTDNLSDLSVSIGEFRSFANSWSAPMHFVGLRCEERAAHPIDAIVISRRLWANLRLPRRSLSVPSLTFSRVCESK